MSEQTVRELVRMLVEELGYGMKESFGGTRVFTCPGRESIVITGKDADLIGRAARREIERRLKR